MQSRYELHETIGEGNYGTLFRGIDRDAASPSDVLIAGKKLKEAGNSRYVLRELSIQRSLADCPHAVRLLDVVVRDHERLLLVLEYLPMNLREFMRAFYCPHRQLAVAQQREPLPYVRAALRGLLAALASLHAKGIAHRDVKPENILVEPIAAELPVRALCPALGFGGGYVTHAGSGCCKPTSQHRPNERRDGDTGGRGGQEGLRDASPSPSPSVPAPVLSELRLSSPAGSAAFHHDMGCEQLLQAISRLHCPQCGAGTTSTISASASYESSSSSINGPSTGGGDSDAEGSGSLGAASPDASSPLSRSSTTTTATSGPLSPALLRPHVKLGDFGSARSIAEVAVLPADQRGPELTGGPTTPVYCAPEMMLGAPYGVAVDLWAVGVIAFELVTGNLLIPVGRVTSGLGQGTVDTDFTEVYRLMKLIYLLGTPTPADWRAITPDNGEYPEAMRLALPQVAASLLFSPGGPPLGPGSDEPLAAVLRRLMGEDGADLLRGLLRYNPLERLTAPEALRHPFFASGD